jgi:hypothetical protein
VESVQPAVIGVAAICRAADGKHGEVLVSAAALLLFVPGQHCLCIVI